MSCVDAYVPGDDAAQLLRTIGASQQRAEHTLAELVAAQRAVEAAVGALRRELGSLPRCLGGTTIGITAATLESGVSEPSTEFAGGTSPMSEAGEALDIQVVPGCVDGDIASSRGKRKPTWVEEESTVPLAASEQGPLDELVAPMLPAGWPAVLKARIGMAENPKVSSVSALAKATTALVRSADKEHESRTAKPGAIANPHSSLNLFLAIFSLFVLMQDLTVTPYVLAWQVEFQGFVLAAAVGSASFWTLDMFLHLVRGFYSKEELIFARAPVFWHYLRTWLLPDLVVTVCDWLGIIVSITNESAGDLNVLRLVRLSRLLRIAGVLRVMRIMRNIRDIFDRRISDGLTWLASVIFVVAIGVFVHMVTCVWVAIGRYAPTDTGYRWMTRHDVHGEFLPIIEYNVGLQYVSALHWAIAQLIDGEIEIMCTNTVERCFAILCVLVGSLLQTVLISSLSATMVEQLTAQREMVQQLRKLRRYLAENHIDGMLSTSALRQASMRLTDTRRLTPKDVPVLDMLSTALRMEVHEDLCRPKLLQHSLFRLFDSISPTFTSHFCNAAVQIEFLSTSDNLFIAGSTAAAAYVLSSGKMLYRQVPESSAVAAPSSRELGPGTWLAESTLWSEWIHVGTAEASQQCKVLSLRPEMVLQAVQRHHILHHISLAYGVHFYKRVVEAVPPLAEFPNDLTVPATSFEEIVSAMPSPMGHFIGMQACRHLHSSRSVLGSRQELNTTVDKLSKELLEGKCIVVLNGAGDVVRITFLSSLHIVADSGHILYQLGRVEGDEVKATLQLPGSKRRAGETSADVVNRLLEAELAPFAGVIQIGRAVHDSVVDMSEKYGVPTRYMRTVYEATFRGEEEVDAPWCPAPPLHLPGARRPSDASTGRGLVSRKAGLQATAVAASPRRVYALFDCGVAKLYSWLSDEEAQRCKTSEGRSALQAWLSDLTLPADPTIAI